MIHCDDRLKHDRLLTLIWLFEYRNSRTRVLLVHDDKQHTTTYLHRVQQFMCPMVCTVLTLHKMYQHEHAMQRPGFLVVSGSKTSLTRQSQRSCMFNFWFLFQFLPVKIMFMNPVFPENSGVTLLFRFSFPIVGSVLNKFS